MADGPLSIRDLLAADSEADQLRELLHDVIDPELGVDIVSLGLVYDVRVDDRRAAIVATTTTPACPLGDYISSEIERVAMASGSVDQVTVEITHDPAWSPDLMNDATKRAFGWT